YFCAPFCTKECCTMLRIVPVKAFKDNYVWTLRNATHAAVVDPGEARPVLDYLSRERLELAAILATHHHPDHVGGIAELVATSACARRASRRCRARSARKRPPTPSCAASSPRWSSRPTSTSERA